MTEQEPTPCDDCVDPARCLSQCIIQEILKEDVAAIREETE